MKFNENKNEYNIRLTFIQHQKHNNMLASCRVTKFSYKLENTLKSMRFLKLWTYFWSLSVYRRLLSENVVCCIHLLTLLSNESIEAHSVDPDQTAPTGAV